MLLQYARPLLVLLQAELDEESQDPCPVVASREQTVGVPPSHELPSSQENPMIPILADSHEKLFANCPGSGCLRARPLARCDL